MEHQARDQQALMVRIAIGIQGPAGADGHMAHWPGWTRRSIRQLRQHVGHSRNRS